MTIISHTRFAATIIVAGALTAPVAAQAKGKPDTGHGRSSAAAAHHGNGSAPAAHHGNGSAPAAHHGNGSAPTAHHGNGREKAKRNPTVTYVFTGTVFSVDAAAGTAVVKVARTNHHAKSTVGAVTFDIAKARVAVADANADHVADLADVAAGDRVVVQARLPRRSPDLSGTVVARKLVDQTRPEDAAGRATEAPAAG
jgi:hypothetical protein